MPATKQCSTCQQWKGPTAFTVDRARRDGLNYRCRACVSDAGAALRAAARRRQEFIEDTGHPEPCQRCLDRQHGIFCLGPGADCGCRCRPILGLEGPFEYGDPTVPFTREAIIDEA